MNVKNIFYLIIILIASGCSTVEKSTIAVHVDVDAESNLNVDVNVGEQITGHSSGTFLFDSYINPRGLICIQCPQEYTANVFRGAYWQLKAAAVHEAMKGTNADLIINPQYTINRQWNPFWSTVDVTVTGRIGTIDSISKEKREDIINYNIDLD
mgnify:CR=1 FL=1